MKNDWELNRRVYAADFGAGNICLYAVNPDAATIECAPLNDPKGEPAGYVIRKNGSMGVGLALLSCTFQQLSEIDSFKINIKSVPTPENREEMILYFRAWLNKIREENGQEFEGVEKEYWLIGCPTKDEWKKKEIRDYYRDIFESAGMQNVIIVPESNAALAYYEKTNNVLKHSQTGKKLLMLDQGAYSVDGTFFSNGSIHSFGYALGAGLIERMLLRTILYESEETIRVGKRIINMPEVVEAARKLYESEGPKGEFATYLLLQTRKYIKEEFFNRESANTLRAKMDLTQTTDFELPDCEEYPFTLFTNAMMMRRVLEEKSVREIMGTEFFELPQEVRRDLGNNSWMGTFRQYLDDLDKHFGGFEKSKDLYIMMTGGGSLMGCVREAVKSKYKDALVFGDNEGIFAIGKGLGYWSGDKIKALDFETAFNAFLSRRVTDDDGDHVSIISSKLTNSLGDCLLEMAKQVVQEEQAAALHGLQQWAQYQCVSSEIPQKMEIHFRDWCKETGIPSFTDNILKHIGEIKKELNKDFIECVLLPLKMKADSEDVLLKPDDEVFLSVSSSIMPAMFDMVTDIIIDHYKKHPNWKKFPDVSKGFFKDRRAEWLNKNLKDICEWIDGEVSSTVDLIGELFVNHEFEFNSEIKGSFANLYLAESYTDLENLMNQRIRKILGTLVLEEYLDI